MLSSGKLERHIQEKLIPCYAARYHSMVKAIKEHLGPLGVKISTGKPYQTTVVGTNNGASFELAGGFFLLIALPPGSCPAPVLAKKALEQLELKFAYGKMFEVKGDLGSKQRSEKGYGNTIRLCWAFHDEEAITEGIIRMKNLLLESLN